MRDGESGRAPNNKTVIGRNWVVLTPVMLEYQALQLLSQHLHNENVQIFDSNLFSYLLFRWESEARNILL